MRAVLAAFALLGMAACGPVGRDAGPRKASELVIYGTTGNDAFGPVVAEFRRLHPDVAISYHKLNAGPLFRRYVAEASAKRPQADVLISSAMDLQVKLVNDGYAASHVSQAVEGLPVWAKWRDQAFAITFEPVVMVFNSRLMKGRRIPASRRELLDDLNHDPAFWRDRVGTYDIATSSVGYLLASQDARQGSDFGSLMQAFRNARLRTSTGTAELFEKLERGQLVMGYNLLGSYAWRRVEAGAPLTIVYPHDYTLALSRVAVIPKDAPNATNAHDFLDYLLSPQGQRTLAARSNLSAVRPGIAGPFGRPGISQSQIGPLRPISLGPGLLTYLDQQKRRRLIETWARSVAATEPPVPPSGTGAQIGVIGPARQVADSIMQ